MGFHIASFVGLVYISCVLCQTEDINSTTVTQDITTGSSSISPFTSTATPVNVSCEQYDGDCENCVKNKKCYYCQENKKCHSFEIEDLIPNKQCSLKQRNLGTCKLNLMIVMILVGVGAGLLLLFVIVICCYCCCKSGGRIRLTKDDIKWARQREERKMRADAKRDERAARTEEIRRKYGLCKDETPYQRFDA